MSPCSRSSRVIVASARVSAVSTSRTVLASAGDPSRRSWSSVWFQIKIGEPTVVVPAGPGLDQTAAAVPVVRDAELGRPSPASIRKRVVARLGDAADREQAESAVQQSRWAAELLEVVRRHPVREGVDPAGRRAHAAQQEGAGRGAVAHLVEVGRRDSPLRPEQAGVGVAVASERRAQVERRTAVRVGRDEVDGCTGLTRVCASRSSTQPARRGRRPADGQARVDVLDRGCGDVVEVEPLVPGAGPEHLEVGLVPDLEVPPEHLVEAVPVDQVLDQALHEVVPALPVLGRGDVRGVLEDGLATGRRRGRAA